MRSSARTTAITTSGMMRALSVRQPWATAILVGGKDIENRSWPTRYRGRIAIHAGQQLDVAALPVVAARLGVTEAALRQAPRGALLGTVEVVDCVATHPSLWFEGPYGFVLRHPVALAEPIALRGRLNLFTLPEEIAARLR